MIKVQELTKRYARTIAVDQISFEVAKGVHLLAIPPPIVNLNEQIIRPLLSNVAVVGLFFIPMITMRLFAEEKRTGTIELLVTSPVRDLEIIVGKWLAAMILYSCLLLFTALNFAFLFKYGNPDWKPLLVGYLGLLLQAGALLAIGTFIFHADQEPDHRRRGHIWSLPASVGAGMGKRV